MGRWVEEVGRTSPALVGSPGGASAPWLEEGAAVPRSWPREGSSRSGARCLPGHPLLVDLASAHPAVYPFSALSLLSSPSLWLPGMDSPPPHPPRPVIKRRPTVPPGGARNTVPCRQVAMSGSGLPLSSSECKGQGPASQSAQLPAQHMGAACSAIKTQQTAGCEHTARAGRWNEPGLEAEPGAAIGEGPTCLEMSTRRPGPQGDSLRVPAPQPACSPGCAAGGFSPWVLALVLASHKLFIKRNH